MNAAERILSALSDTDLKDAVDEVKQLERTGILTNGKVREISGRVAMASGIKVSEARQIVQNNLRQMAHHGRGILMKPQAKAA